MKRLDPSTATDSELLALFEQVRDESAFSEVVRRHGPMVMSTVSRALDNTEDAKDAFQATFLALAKGVGRLRNKDYVAAWLHATARKTASSIRRSSDRRAERMREFTQMALQRQTNEEPDDMVACDEALRVLDNEIDKLPHKLRIVVVLCHLEGLSQRQVAHRLGVHTNTVRERLTKAKEKLRKGLVRRGMTIAVGAILAGGANRSVEAAAVTTPSLVSETTTMAFQFITGQSTGFGAKASVLRAADEILVSISLQKLATAGLVALAMLLVGYGSYSAVSAPTASQLPLVDDFSDGNISDGLPGTWVPGGAPGGTRVARNGDLVLSTNGNDMSTWITELEGLVDVSLQVQFSFDQVSGNGDSFALIARSDSSNGTYAAGMMDSGILFIVHSDGKRNTILSGDRSSINPVASDVVLRFDISGNLLELSAWPADGVMPDAPQLSIADQRLTEGGQIGFSLAPNASGGSEFATVSVRSFAATPRRSSFAAFGAGLLIGTQALRRKRHFNA